MAVVARPRLNALQAILIGLIELYRHSLAFVLGGQCRFYPTCSRYGLEAVRRHGALGGSWLTMKRLVRCHPWHPGGPDPVPDVAVHGDHP